MGDVSSRALTTEGASLRPLREIPTEGGPVLHMLRSDSPEFTGFGEVYFSECVPGAMKGWKLHTRQTQLFAVPRGVLRVVLYRDGVYDDILLGRPDHYGLLCIPPQTWYAFGAVGSEPALVCNCANFPHDPEEARRVPLREIKLP